MSRYTPFVLLLAGALTVGVGCNKDDKDSMSKSSSKSAMDKSGKTLYERLGGKPAVTAVVHDSSAAAGDPKVNFTRKGTSAEWNASPANVAKLEMRLVEFIAANTGGPKEYKGRDMVTAHTGMKISDDEFNALAADLGASLDKFKVPKKEKDELIAVVASTRGSIVGK